MLSQASRQEILRKIGMAVGHPIMESDLTEGTRQSITNLASIQRNLSVMDEILLGETERLNRSPVLRLSSRLSKDKELEVHSAEVRKLRTEVDGKVAELARQVAEEETALKNGTPLPQRGDQVKTVELKCPACGAPLPMPSARVVKCQYCDASVGIDDVSEQIKSVIARV